MATDEVGGFAIGVELGEEGAGGGNVAVFEAGVDEGFFLGALGGGEDEIGLGVEGGDGEERGGKAGFRGGMGCFVASWDCFAACGGGMRFAALVLWVDGIVMQLAGGAL
ncbi:MAG: hypothetical protein ACRCXD_10110 [Luteolibacter sp.]